MRKTAFAAPAFALAAGAAGFVLRKEELAAAFELDTGLALRNAPVTVLLAGFSAAVILAAMIFAIAVAVKYVSPQDYGAAFAPTGGFVSFVISAISIVWLAVMVKYAFDIRAAGALSIVEIYFAALSVLSALSVALFSITAGKKQSGGAAMLFSVVPSLFLCFWLILLYKQNASNPVLNSYCYQSLAIITAALSFYFTAGFVYDKPAPAKMLLCSLTSVFFCCVTLADSLALEIKAVYAAAALIAIIRSTLLISNLNRYDKQKGS